MRKQHIFFVLAIAVGFMVLAAPAVAQVKFGFVDLQRALNETGEGRVAKNRLKRIFNKRQNELDKMQKRLKRMQKELKKQKEILSDEAFAKRFEAFQKAYVELQTKYVEYQRDLSERETKETGRIIKRMQSILSELGTSKNYTAIVEVNEAGVFYFRKSLDMTNELIRLYDERHPAKGRKRGKRGKAKGKKGGGKAPPAQHRKLRPVL